MKQERELSEDIEELKEGFEVIEAELKKELDLIVDLIEVKAAMDDMPMNYFAVSRLLKIPISSLRKLVMNKEKSKIPVHKLNRKVYFFKSEVIQWLRSK